MDIYTGKNGQGEILRNIGALVMSFFNVLFSFYFVWGSNTLKPGYICSYVFWKPICSSLILIYTLRAFFMSNGKLGYFTLAGFFYSGLGIIFFVCSCLSRLKVQKTQEEMDIQNKVVTISTIETEF